MATTTSSGRRERLRSCDKDCTILVTELTLSGNSMKLSKGFDGSQISVYVVLVCRKR